MGNVHVIAEYWLQVIERLVQMKQFVKARAKISKFQVFCNKYGLLSFRFESELILFDVSIEIGDIELAMVQLS